MVPSMFLEIRDSQMVRLRGLFVCCIQVQLSILVKPMDDDALQLLLVSG
jgi:hypothetical protein